MCSEAQPEPPTKKTANGGHNHIILQPNAAPSTPQPPAHALRSRLLISAGLVLLAFAMVPFVPARVVDPGHRWFVLDPLIGLLLYWPLSRVFLRATNSLLWGNLLALLPAAILVTMRFFGNQRDPVFGTQPTLSFGTMIVLSVCSLAAYLLFRTPPRK